MRRLIDAGARAIFIDCGHLNNRNAKLYSENDIREMIDMMPTQPTVDAVPVEWIKKYTEENRLYQSDDFDIYISDMIADWAERKEE